MNRLERLVNLVALLAATDHPIPQDEIVVLVPGYSGSKQAMRRTFERDKRALRDMGIDVLAEPLDPFASRTENAGYRIPADELIPDPGLTVAERSAVALATALVWDEEPEAERPADAAVHGKEAALLALLLDAVMECRVLRFEYGSLSGAHSRRTVEPWQLVYRSGVAYIVGLDRDAGDERCFRVDRVVGDVRTGGAGGFARPRASRQAVIPRRPWEVGKGDPVEVSIAVRPDRAWWVEKETKGTQVGEITLGDEVWIEIVVPARNVAALVGWVQGLRGDGFVTSPASAADSLVRNLLRLREVVA